MYYLCFLQGLKIIFFKVTPKELCLYFTKMRHLVSFSGIMDFTRKCDGENQFLATMRSSNLSRKYLSWKNIAFRTPDFLT